jgi:hypothetical protein
VIDQLVEFFLSADRLGRPCAVRVTRADERVPGEIKRNDRSFYSVYFSQSSDHSRKSCNPIWKRAMLPS